MVYIITENFRKYEWDDGMVDNWITYTTSNEKQHHVLRILTFQQWKVPQKTCSFWCRILPFPSTTTNTWLLLSCWQYSFRLAVLVWYFQAFYPASVMLWKFEKWNLQIWHWGWSCANVEDNKLRGTFKERSARAACDCQVVQNHACTMNLCKSLLGYLAHCILIAILLAKFVNETWIARTTAP